MNINLKDLQHDSELFLKELRDFKDFGDEYLAERINGVLFGMYVMGFQEGRDDKRRG